MSANDKKLVSYKDLMRRRQELAASASLPPPESSSVPDSLPSPDSLPGDGSQSRETVGYRGDSLPAADSLSGDDSPKVDLWTPFREKKGHLRQPHAYTDGLCAVLDVYEQAAFTQLYRLSHGFGKPMCKIGLPQLAARSGMGKTAAQAAVNRLIAKGLVRKLEIELGKNKEQGTTYWVSSPDSLPGDGRLSGDGYNKVKALKETTKKGAHARKDYSACPDCQGTGMWYPEGFEKGVARCRHEQLK